MRAAARIVAESAGRAGTRLAVLHGESPLLLRRTGPRSPGAVTVHLVGGAAGPLRGDDLSLDVTVCPDATLTLHSVAAQLALPGRRGLPSSRLTIRAEVAATGTLLRRDDLVCGRHDEPAGDVRTRTTIRYAGATVHRHELAVGPAAPGWSGAAVLGTGRAIGTVVATPPPATGWAPRAAQNRTVGDFAVMPLAGPGMLATAVAPDIRQVRAALDPLCASPAAVVQPA